MVACALVSPKQRILPRSIYMMFIHESHVFELGVEMKFEVCDPGNFFYATYVVTRKGWTRFEP